MQFEYDKNWSNLPHEMASNEKNLFKKYAQKLGVCTTSKYTVCKLVVMAFFLSQVKIVIFLPRPKIQP